MKNIVFIATSIDGYIADINNGIDWLHSIPNPNGDDMGYNKHIASVDALVMGRNTFELVASFDCDWPYDKPVFVLSTTLTAVDDEYKDKVFLINGELESILLELHNKGFKNLYIDGGITIQNFLKKDLIDELIITTIPILLGGGIALFGELTAALNFKHVSSHKYLDTIVQNHFVRTR